MPGAMTVLRWKRGGSLSVQGEAYEVRDSGGPRWTLGSYSREAHQERAGRDTLYRAESGRR
jgi:hypothetical protein